MFNPSAPDFLYASFRYREGVYAWDLRSPDAPFAHYTTTTEESTATTEDKTKMKMSSQRHHFAVDMSGRWLSIGDEVRSLPPSP